MKNGMKILTALAVFTLSSCSNKEAFYEPSYVKTGPSLESIEQTTNNLETVDRKIIREGDIEFETADIQQTRTAIMEKVQELNGYLSEDRAYTYPEKIEHKLTIRVPADKFDQLLNAITTSAVKLESKSIRALDVTEEYLDIETRILTKKELLARYTDILKQATKVNELLEIEKEIGNLQEDIESVEKRIMFLKDRIAFSTLSVTCYQKAKPAFGFSSKFVAAIKGGWNGFLWFLIALTNLWVFILLAFVLIFTYRLWKKKRKKS